MSGASKLVSLIVGVILPVIKVWNLATGIVETAFFVNDWIMYFDASEGVTVCQEGGEVITCVAIS